MSAVDDILRGGGACGALLRQVDWPKTPLGPVETWPQSLRTAVGIVLASDYPLYVAWGPEFVQFYNDAYRPICGRTKHPAALGQAAAVTWPEVWHMLGPGWERIRQTGEAIFVTDLMMPLDRNGFVEECYFTYSHSPVRDESGDVAGIFAALTETTGQVVGTRRLDMLRELGASTADRATTDEACREAMRVIAAAPLDVPFALLYVVDDATGTARLAGTSGLAAGDALAPGSLPLPEGEASAAWPLGASASTGAAFLWEKLPGASGTVAVGPWPEGTASAWVQPLPRVGHARPAGFLITGLSRRLAFDAKYQGFLELLARGVTTAISQARAREEERRRADALAALDRAKTDFFSNVSHEFRTPLALMLGPVEDGLQDALEPLGPRQLERQRTVHRNGLRLLKLVNTLLEFSRIEAGHLHTTAVPTDLAALTRGLASGFRSTVERAGLTLDVDCPPLPHPVKVEPDQWEKIVLNLISNAFKFTHQGGIRVSLRSHEAQVVLRVADTGTGIPPEELPRIFDRFHRVQGAKGRSYEGSGIGLALVRELVRLHGGDVRAESHLGQGTTFTVTLPAEGTSMAAPVGDTSTPAHVPASATAAAFLEEASGWMGPEGTPTMLASGTAPAPLTRTVGGHILFADDNADMRAYVRSLLADRFEVTLAENGQQALESCRARMPDLVVSDVMMPELDGFGLLRRLREDPATAHVPVILLSARAGEEATVEGLRMGATDYLVKPFSARELLARVEGNLVAARARREQRQAEREREKLIAVVEQSSDLIGIGGPDGRALFVNEAGQRMLGLEGPEAVRRTHLFDYFLEEDRSYVREVILPRLRERGRWDGEFRLRHFRTGAAVPVHYNFFMLRDAATGEDIGIATVSRDITERHRREAEAREQREFEQQLIGIVSHDLRSPINAILLSANALLKRDDLGERATKNTGRIISSAERANRLIRDLLDVTQARLGGGLPVHRRRMDFHEATRHALEEVQVAFPERQVLLDAQGDGLGSWDEERLGQVVQNLVTNALRYSEPGSTVRVSTREEGDNLVLEVHNRGRPIPPEMLPTLFQAMRRGPQDEGRSSRSVGLGLYIVQQVARAHGGHVSAASSEADGTTFTVRLPREAPPAYDTVS
ncbi:MULTISPECIES: ATP-binding response regulator [unclassified Corallococcus]|uniref:ATP-binding response regulator n=1 Tax=unclassified Corallococcus TaxID=2685029 RepID=UPI001A8D15C6|nr:MULTISPECIES: ATP-binding protein [unclassified Corallococcus]MBN9684921.1 response regulator [Corallococcus sp. NCSPR001]WAS83616.1 ATP-binding protein [Corallococcus sp. NCRR]